MSRHKIITALVAASLAAAGVVQAAAGDLDTTFGGDGEVVMPVVSSRTERGFDSVIQPDGRIVIAGKVEVTGSDTDMIVMRLNKNGSADASFGLGLPTSLTLGGVRIGTAADNEAAYSVALQPDGKIVVGGSTDVDGHSVGQIVRLTKTGALDLRFGGGDGMVELDRGVNTKFLDVVALPDGKLLALALAEASSPVDLIVARYTKNGVLDKTNGGGDGMTVLSNAVVIELLRLGVDQRGRALIATAFRTAGVTEARVVRLTSRGTLDRTFGGGDGTMTLTPPSGQYVYPTAVRVQPDGKLLVVGASGPLIIPSGGSLSIGVYVARLTARGAMDPTMSNGVGWVSSFFAFDTIPWDVEMQPDGKILVFAVSSGPGNSTVMRFNRDATLDSTFGGSGSVAVWSAQVLSGNIQPDGAVVATGYRNNGSDDDIYAVRLEARSVLARAKWLSPRALMAGHRTVIPVGARFRLSVARSSKGSCSVSRGGIKAVKSGTCTVTVSMTPPKTSAYPRPKTVRSTIVLTITG